MSKLEYIAEKTVKFRYKLASFILKRLTPVLYKKIDITTFNKRVFQFKTDNIHITIRPSVNFMKKIFDGRLVKGAELGVERARNSKSILRELNIEKLYLIDVWDIYKGIDYNWSKENYNHVIRILEDDKRVRIIKDYSENAVKNIEDNSLDFVYIDANHNYDYVCKDINLWYPKVKEGGIIGGHDICIPDVLKAVKEFCSDKNIKFQTEIPDWYFIKHEKENKDFSGKFYYNSLYNRKRR